MTTNVIVTIVLITLTLTVFCVGIYFYVRNKTLDEIRTDVYQLFLKAEHLYTESGEGKQKMKWVISRARALLPKWAQLFITDELLYKVVEGWFGAVKDLLDDGKYNKSTEVTE